MPLARPPDRSRRLARELTTYSAVGIANTAIDFALFNGLITLGWLAANTISTVVSTTSSYFMNRHWVYRDRPKTAVHRGYALFFAVNVFGLVIQAVVLLLLTRYGLPAHSRESRLQLNAFKCVGVVVALFFRFWAYRTLVFRPHSVGPAGPGTAAVDPGAINAGAINAGTVDTGTVDAAATGAAIPEPARPAPPAAGPAVNPAPRTPGADNFKPLAAPLAIELSTDLGPGAGIEVRRRRGRTGRP